MNKKVAMALLSLTTMFVLGGSSLAYAGTVTDSNKLPVVTTDDANDNSDSLTGLNINANKTGDGVGTNDGSRLNDVVKTIDMTKNDKTTGTERTHGEYQNNTNACASCHQTHTAAGKNLTFKNSNYATCTACHDGTLGFYNVFDKSSAGLFNGSTDGNASMHLANGITKVSAAPGGNKEAAADDEVWGAEFDCASCHSPHGSYSDRLLNYNPNDVANTPMAEGGIQVSGLSSDSTIYTVVPDAASADSPAALIYKTTASDATYGLNIAGDSTPTFVVLKKSGTSYKRDMSPWLAGGEYGQPAFSRFTTVANEKAMISGITVNYAKGYAQATTDTVANSVEKAVIARAVVVKFDMTQNTGVSYGLPIMKVSPTSYDKAGYGTQITQFCAACHTDYLAKSGSESGVWSQAFRHTTNSDSYTCLKCHFAHGTDVTVMMDAKDRSVADLEAAGWTTTEATNYMKDNNPDSALKRYTNMSICWKCHTKSHSTDLVQNEWVQGVPNSGTTQSTEFNTSNQGSNPNGWVAPSKFPY